MLVKGISRTPGRHYFISMFIIAAALFATFTTVIYRHYDDSAQLNRWVIYNYELARRSRLILIDLLNMETGMRGYLLTGKQEFLEPYNKSTAALPDQISGLLHYKMKESDNDKDIALWTSRIQALQKLFDAQIKNRNHLSQAQIVQTLYQQKQQMDKVRGVIERDIATRVNIVRDQLDKFHTEQRRFLVILIAGTVLVILAMLLATLIILSLIARNKKAHEETELAEERFRAVMNGLGDGMYDFHPIDKTIYVSPAYHEMLGYDASEFPQELNSITRIMHSEDAEQVWASLERYAKKELSHFSVAFRMLHKNGTWRWVLSRGIGFWDKKGQLVRLIGTHSDITEQKQREEELSLLNSELETYTYIASHDLRSPLVNLKGFARELKYSVDELTPVIRKLEPTLSAEDLAIVNRSFEHDIPEAVDFIIKSAERMDTLTTAVLDLSRIGKRDYTRQRVKVNEIVQKCLDGQAYEISRNTITITVDPLPQLMTDPLALEQIFTNLIDNAIKYLRPDVPGIIHIAVRETASDAIFEVRDNGRGIAEEDLPKVFEIFRRARNTDNIRGQGMGMAFVKATVRKLGGTIWCSSVLGEGTIFYVRLPRIMHKEQTKG